MEYLFEVITLIILLGFSIFFSGSETAIFHLSKVTVEKLRTRYQLINQRERLLSTILLGNTLANIGASIIAARLFYRIFNSTNQAIITGIMTYIILVIGEFLPKIYSLRNAEKVSIKAMPILNLIRYLFLPITVPINAIMQIITPQSLPHALITREELKVLAEYQAEQGNITNTEKDFVVRLLDFKSKKVEDIMTRVEKIESIQSSELHTILAEDNLPKLLHSRIPVHKNNRIIGILYLKDLFKGPKIVLRKPHFVQQTMPAPNLLSYFQKQRVHIAIVIDKHKNTKGLVTLDDILKYVFSSSA